MALSNQEQPGIPHQGGNYAAKRKYGLQKRRREEARTQLQPRLLVNMSREELNQEWHYTWDDLDAYRHRPKGVAKSTQWEQTKQWLERRLKKIELLLQIAEQAT